MQASLHNSFKLPTIFFLAITMTSMLIGCGETNILPRPKGWPRIGLPEHTYKRFENPACPLSFDYPSIGEISSARSDSCIADIYFPLFECKWHLTYTYVNRDPQKINEYFEEYRKLVYRHIQKVTQIEEVPLRNKIGHGMMYELYGAVAVPAQIIFTDSTHMIMMSLYFNEAITNDSLAPVIRFMKDDLKHVAESIRFE